MRIAVVGTGYVGLVTGVCLAEVGHTVTCVDSNAQKIETLKRGKAPIFEPGIESYLRRNAEHDRLHFSTNLAESLIGAECVFIAVGTPQGEDGSADLRYVTNVAREIGENAVNDMLVIVKSTVPVGTCAIVQSVVEEQLSKRSSPLKLPVASNPEFLKEGTAIDDFMHPDRIVAGVDDEGAAQSLRELYRPFIIDDPSKLFIMDRHSSELTKYGANAMLATRISFMNELARLCEKVGANIDHVRLGMGADPRIGRKFLYAGPGYGGSCFPKDVAALVRSGQEYGVELAVLNAVEHANTAQKVFVAEKIVRYFGGSLAGKRIALWGLAFKPGTDDVREAPAKTIVQRLLAQGAEVVAHDPEAAANFRLEVQDQPGLRYASSAYDALAQADALVLVTEWSEYKRPNWNKVKEAMRGRAVFDLRNQYMFEALKAAGIHYVCVGRPDSTTKSS